MRTTPAGVALIHRKEGDEHLIHPYWPGGASGITVPDGYDLGQHSEAQFRHDFGPYLPAATITALAAVCGHRGSDAQHLLPTVVSYVIPVEASRAVFAVDSLPDFERETLGAFPGSEALPGDAFSALVDLVYNRGPLLTGDRRVEMAAIAIQVAKVPQLVNPADVVTVLRIVATLLRQMGDRLWPVTVPVTPGNANLRQRRYDEADLVLSCIPALQAGAVTV